MSDTRQRFLIPDGRVLARLSAAASGLDILFDGNFELWIADLALIDAELAVGVGEQGAAVRRWLESSRQRLKVQTTDAGANFRNALENWHRAGRPAGLKPIWMAERDTARLLAIQSAVELLQSARLVVVSDDRAVKNCLGHAYPGVMVSGTDAVQSI